MEYYRDPELTNPPDSVTYYLDIPKVSISIIERKKSKQLLTDLAKLSEMRDDCFTHEMNVSIEETNFWLKKSEEILNDLQNESILHPMSEVWKIEINSFITHLQQIILQKELKSLNRHEMDRLECIFKHLINLQSPLQHFGVLYSPNLFLSTILSACKDPMTNFDIVIKLKEVVDSASDAATNANEKQTDGEFEQGSVTINSGLYLYAGLWESNEKGVEMSLEQDSILHLTPAYLIPMKKDDISPLFFASLPIYIFQNDSPSFLCRAWAPATKIKALESRNVKFFILRDGGEFKVTEINQ